MPCENFPPESCCHTIQEFVKKTGKKNKCPLGTHTDGDTPRADMREMEQEAFLSDLQARYPALGDTSWDQGIYV